MDRETQRTQEVDMDAPKTPELLPTASTFDPALPKLVPLIPRPKRANPYSDLLSPSGPAHQRKKNTKHGINNLQIEAATAKISEARQLLIEAAADLSEDRDEQSKVLDLLEIFRSYLEKKELPAAKTAKILAKQVANLEAASKKINEQSKQPRTFAQVAASNSNTHASQTTANSQGEASQACFPLHTAPGQSWTEVKGKREKAKASHSASRLILTLSNKEQTINSFQLRNQLNKALNPLGSGKPAVLSVSKSMKGNLVLTLADHDAQASVMQNIEAVKKVIPIAAVLEDETWFKVVLHGVSTKDFDGPDGPTLIKEEIEMYNRGLKVVNTPIWLTHEDKRMTVDGGSVLVAFNTEDEARRAIQSRLYVGGVSVRVEKARDKEQTKRNERTSTQSTC